MDVSVGGGDVFAPGFELAAARLGGVENVSNENKQGEYQENRFGQLFHEGTLSIMGIFCFFNSKQHYYFNWVAKL